MVIRDFKNAVGYIRVSTDGQIGEDKYGADSQRQEILDYANKNGYNIVAWFTDQASGVSDDRPEFDKILYGNNITNPPFEAVIAFKSDRVARDTKLYFYYLYVLEKKNIKLISTREDFVEGSEFANIYRAITMYVAEQERKNIALRTGNGRKMKAAAGGYSGGKAPFGYMVKEGRLVINDSEADIVRLIYEMNKRGEKMLRIAETLNDSGYVSRSGGKFYSSHIKAILQNEPVYRGMYRYGVGKEKKDVPWVPGVHEPILKD